MGLLVDGKWQDRWYDTASTGGRFVRDRAMMRNWVTADGSAGATGEGGFKAEAGRYHLYVSYACPWAHRTLIVRTLKGLQDVISFDVVHPIMGKEGWVFDPSFPGSTPDHINGASRLYEVYLKNDAAYTGRVTTPVLWDKERGVTRQQRVGGHHQDDERGLCRCWRIRTGPLPRGASRRDRGHQSARLSQRQRRRLSLRLRHDARRL
jgi:glutathionyl-hydroquinone reductase